jgi:hypothetical protein
MTAVLLALIPILTASAIAYEVARRRLPSYRAYLAAKANLEANADRSRAAGLTDETEEYLMLNRRVGDAVACVPTWARWGMR